ncbi:MAG: cation transporter [Deltaproteobacteria bacterium]|nr:cation transporter [Deltaproteobacteria bacterium]MBZ0219583.1 cation diffusion facilitator family transporter [Deltaproteobacteria bacterium]
MDAHKHDPHGHEGVDADSGLKKRLIVSITLTSVIFLAELIGGFLTNSLALMTDAAHVFMDVFALSLSLFAIYIAELPPTEKRTYGFHRVEVFVSFINSFVLVLITGFIFYKGFIRFFNPEPVESAGVLIVGSIGLVVNLVVAKWLHGHAKADLNVRSAFIHVVGDAAASVGVIVSAAVIYYTGWYPIDPLISMAICALIINGAVKIIRESSHILLEGVPRDIDFNRVRDDILSPEGVSGVHSLHIWSICHNVYALSAHIDVVPTQRWRMGEIFSEINERLAHDHHIFYTTLQAECSGCEPNDIFRKIAHRGRGHLH